MINEIKQTDAFKSLAKFQQDLVIKRQNRTQIEDAIVQARNLGYEVWASSSTFPPHWKNIVREIAETRKEEPI